MAKEVKLCGGSGRSPEAYSLQAVSFIALAGLQEALHWKSFRDKGIFMHGGIENTLLCINERHVMHRERNERALCIIKWDIYA